MGGMHGRWDCRGWGILNKHSKRKKFLNFLTLRHFVLDSTVQYVSHVVYKILFTVLFIYILDFGLPISSIIANFSLPHFYLVFYFTSASTVGLLEVVIFLFFANERIGEWWCRGEDTRPCYSIDEPDN